MADTSNTKRSWSVDSLVLIFSIIVLCQLLTYVIPQGTFERQPLERDPTRVGVVADSYATLKGDDRVALEPWHFLTAIPRGFRWRPRNHFFDFRDGRRHKDSARERCDRRGATPRCAKLGRAALDTHSRLFVAVRVWRRSRSAWAKSTFR